MRFGLFSLFDFHPDRQDEVTFIRDSLDLFVLGEKFGFSSAWIGEEHFYHFGIIPSPPILLAALAQRTTTMRLGTAIALTQFQNPLRLAEDYALLDILSDGRVDLGVGRGAIPAHFDGFNVDVATSRERHLEALSVLRAAWSDRKVAHSGKYWTIPPLSVSPRPIQRPHPPIYQGTVSPESFENAGRHGDGAFVVAGAPLTDQVMAERLALYRRTLAEHGHVAPPPVFIYQLFLNRSRETAEREARAAMETYWDLLASVGGDSGSGAALIAARRAQMKDNLHESAMIGTPGDVVERLKRLRADHGAEHVAFYLNAGARPTESARANLEMFAAEVMPALRDD
jgi:alkanesulfonate monooxygenase SsuD/methylene tetrahydromethanopterin reductase-like flavin-dependent oxidoreductase (luciferase family)